MVVVRESWAAKTWFTEWWLAPSAHCPLPLLATPALAMKILPFADFLPVHYSNVMHSTAMMFLW